MNNNSILDYITDINALEYIFVALLTGNPKECFQDCLSFSLVCKKFFTTSENLIPFETYGKKLFLHYGIYLQMFQVKQQVDLYYNVKNVDGMLFYCSKYGFYNLIELLVSLGANINTTDFRKTPLTVAISLNKTKTAQNLILQKEINLNQIDNAGSSPLILAIKTKNFDVAKILIIEEKINLNLWVEYNTAISAACSVQNLEIIEILCSQKQKINLAKPANIEEEADGALHIACSCYQQKLDIMKILSKQIGFKEELNRRDYEGLLPQDLATLFGNDKISSFLRKKKEKNIK